MKIRSVLAVLVPVLTLSAGAASPPVSDLTGIHAVIEKVVLEPSEAAPERVQLWGAFLIAGESKPQRGYLYLGLPPAVMYCSSCAPESAAAANARIEWRDLKSIAGTGQGVGFGFRSFRGRVRAASEKPQSPDAYPVFMGLMKLGTHPDVATLNAVLNGRERLE
jgi:hypothetical protein